MVIGVMHFLVVCLVCADVLENHNDDEGKPDRKRARVDISSQDATLKVHSCLTGTQQSPCSLLTTQRRKWAIPFDVHAPCTIFRTLVT